MKILKGFLIVGLLTIILSACAGKKAVQEKPISSAQEPGEKLIWASHEMRPEWTYTEPGIDGEILSFVGVSGKQSTEKLARNDALDTAIGNVVKFVGTFVSVEFEKLTMTYGVPSEIVDPTVATQSFENRFSSGLVSRVKGREFYIEKWEIRRTKDTYYLIWVFTDVPKSAVDEAYIDACNEQIEEINKELKNESEEKAKTQFENAIKAFEDFKKSGILE